MVLDVNPVVFVKCTLNLIMQLVFFECMNDEQVTGMTRGRLSSALACFTRVGTRFRYRSYR